MLHLADPESKAVAGHARCAQALHDGVGQEAQLAGPAAGGDPHPERSPREGHRRRTHGDAGAHRADVILPGAAYPEKSGLYVNTEGRVQMAARASFPPGDAREDWAIVRALSDHLGARLPYDSLGQLRKAIFAAHPHLQHVGVIAAGDGADLRRLAQLPGAPDKAPFASVIDDFYLTNPIARASAVMAECSALAERRTMTAAE